MSDEEFKGFLHYAEYKNIIDIINNSEEAMRSIAKAYDEIAIEKARLKELRSTKPLDADDAKQLARGIRGTVRYIENCRKILTTASNMSERSEAKRTNISRQS